jgi:hypothetical protein
MNESFPCKQHFHFWTTGATGRVAFHQITEADLSRRSFWNNSPNSFDQLQKEFKIFFKQLMVTMYYRLEFERGELYEF